MRFTSINNVRGVLATFRYGGGCFLIGLGILLVSSGVWARPVSVDVPLDHWSYAILGRFAARGLADMTNLSSRPLNRLQMADITQQVIKNIRGYDVGGHPWTYTQSLEEDLDKILEEYQYELVSIGETTLAGEELPKKTDFRLVYPFRMQRFFADLDDNDTTLLRNQNGHKLEEGANLRISFRSWLKVNDIFAATVEPVYYHNREMDDFTVEEAYGRTHLGPIELSVGRSTMWWGTGRFGSLILSNNALPLDTFKIKNIKPVRLPSFLGRIGTMDGTFFFSRLKSSRDIRHAKLAGTRITTSPHPDVSFGFSRTVMMGGERGGDSLGIDDIFKALVVSKENEASESNNNQISMIDVIWRLRNTKKHLPFTNNIVLYGQVAGDGEDKEGFSNLAYLGGIYLPDILIPGLSLCSEYATTKRADDKALWYDHPLYTSGYTFKTHNIGHFMGGDAESLFFRLTKHAFIKPNYELGLQLDRVRTGLSEANTEVRSRASIDFRMFKTPFAEAKFHYIIECIDNYLRVDGARSTNHIFEISGRVEF